MSKRTRLCLFALVVFLLICAVPFLTRWSFAPGRTTVSRPPLSSGSPAPAAAAAPTAFPASEQAEGGVEEAKRIRLQAERRQLKQANATLEDARQQAEADKKRAEQGMQTMAALNEKLLDANLKVPQTVSEAASLMGQNLADAAKFKQKWGDSIPAAGTPEADEYTKEQDDLVSQSAALLKFLNDEKKAAGLGQPDSIAQFQAGSITGALGLRDDQAQSVNTVLDGYYQQWFAQGLNMDARPETGSDMWTQQRLALSKQAYAAVTALLTPEQATAFHSIYPTAGTWMFVLPFGGLPGVTVSH